MLRGLGDCGFEDATDALGLDGGDSWTAAFSATWEGSNRLPTLAFGNYLVPDSQSCADSELVRPAPAGDRYAPPVALSPGYCTLSILFSDWGRSGQRDLRMSNDRHYYIDGEEQLWRIAPDEAPRPYTEADGWKPMQIWGMGIASQDVTGDGYPEVFLTSQGDNKLQTLEDGPDQPAYEDMALEAGVTAQRPYAGGDVLPSTAWHPEFEDVNNDGFVDLFVVEGQRRGAGRLRHARPEQPADRPARRHVRRRARRRPASSATSGRAAPPSSTSTSTGCSTSSSSTASRTRRCGATSGAATPSTPEPMGHWIAIDLEQPAPNVDAIGAWVEVRTGDRTMAREVTVGGGHAGGKNGWIHAGLGDATSADVRVQWPDGETGPWMTVDA